MTNKYVKIKIKRCWRSGEHGKSHHKPPSIEDGVGGSTRLGLCIRCKGWKMDGCY